MTDENRKYFLQEALKHNQNDQWYTPRRSEVDTVVAIANEGLLTMAWGDFHPRFWLTQQGIGFLNGR